MLTEKAYESCTLCPRQCGVNRAAGERGYCGMGATLSLARAALHAWEEPCISGEKGSGTVFFSGCPLRCVYCQNAPIALGEWGQEVPDARLCEIFRDLAAQGAHNINLVTPTHYAPTIATAIRRVREEGFRLPFVYNTSGYERVETLRELDGLIDIYLTDCRYASEPLASRYSSAPDYPATANAAIAEMVRQTGDCVFDADGNMVRGTLVRILLLPGAVVDAKLLVLRLWQAYGNRVCYSLMQQYTPMPGMVAPLDRRVTEYEYRTLVSYAVNLGITQAFTQEREAAEESFIPPFDKTGILKEQL